jgi:hypothetical protein
MEGKGGEVEWEEEVEWVLYNGVYGEQRVEGMLMVI